MMHSGHFNAVRQAKLLAEQVGGVLVVGVHTDAEILANKGPPVMNDEERLAIVTAVKWVDELIFDTPYSATLPFLDSIDADFCVHGGAMARSSNPHGGHPADACAEDAARAENGARAETGARAEDACASQLQPRRTRSRVRSALIRPRLRSGRQMTSRSTRMGRTHTPRRRPSGGSRS